MKMIKELNNAIDQFDDINDEEINGFTVTFRTNKKDDNNNIILKRFTVNGAKLAKSFKETSIIWLKDNLAQTKVNLDEL